MITTAEMVKKNLKITLFGSYPPPFGGVSVHIKRLHFILLENNIQSHVYNFSSSVDEAKNILNMKKLTNWEKFLFIKKNISHVHTTGKHWLWVALYYVFSRINKSKLIISYHSLRYGYHDFNFFSRKVLLIIFNNTSHFIVSNSDIRKTIITLGANQNKISVIPPFLPPANSGNIEEKLPNQINNFIKNHQPVISAYAYSLRTPSLNLHGTDTIDLYGIDLLVDLCVILKRKYPRIGIILHVTHLNDESALKNIRLMILNNNISDNFLIYNKPIESLYILWLKSDVYVRPTLSDGDSVALREALWFNTPSIASDASPRPEGTILFKNRDLNDLTLKVKKVLENYSYYTSKVESLPKQTNINKILNIYNNCVQNDNRL